MTWPNYDGPIKPNKGHEGGACNREKCQDEPALWYNHGSHSWYCEQCSIDIGQDVVNARCWPLDFPRLFPGRPLHPMFETREQIDARAQGVASGNERLWKEREPSAYGYREPLPILSIRMAQSDDRWNERAYLRTPALQIEHYETPKRLTKRARRRLKGRG